MWYCSEKEIHDSIAVWFFLYLLLQYLTSGEKGSACWRKLQFISQVFTEGEDFTISSEKQITVDNSTG